MNDKKGNKDNQIGDALSKLETRVEKAERVREALSMLLDEQASKSGHVFAIKTEMGGNISYTSVAPLSWVRGVGFARDLPSWSNKKDENGRIIIDEYTVQEIQQREPDWSRQQEMVRYMVLQKNHKFPSILIVAWQPWVNDPGAKEWVDGRAIRNSVTEIELNTHKTMFLDLDCSDTSFYALDGQHRLMAILGLFDLIFSRTLAIKRSDGTTKKGSDLTRDDLLSEYCNEVEAVTSADLEILLQSLKEESLGIEIIPAVLKNETRKESLIRLRSIFVHVNKTAKRLSSGEIALLDEDDGFAIVARTAMVTHILLKNRVQVKTGQLRDGSKDYTTLETLRQIAYNYLCSKSSFLKWQATKGGVITRPSEDELERATSQFLKYFDNISTLPSHDDLIKIVDRLPSDYRYTPKKLKDTASEEAINSQLKKKKLDNILFRPIAQMALASAIAELEARSVNIALSVMPTLSAFEQQGGLKLHEKTSIWFGVLCDVVDGKIRRHKSYQELCQRLLVHLFSGTKESEKDELLEKFRDARKTEDDKVYGLDGEIVERSKLNLPPPLM